MFDSRRQHDGSRDELEQRPTETTALLRDGGEDGQPSSASSQPKRPLYLTGLSVASVKSIAGSLKNVPQARKTNTIVNLLCAVVFVASLADGFVDLPMTRILEDILCREHYYDKNVGVGVGVGGNITAGPPIDERLCKENAIQERLAFILAFQQTLTSIVSIAAAFPWGLVADKIGRKPVVVLSLFGTSVNVVWIIAVLYWQSAFPVTAIWYSSLFHVIGGGNSVIIAILLSMMCDATSEDERGVAFLRLHAASLCGNLVSPSLAAVVMERAGPWIGPFIGIGIIAVSAVAFVFVPETLPPHKLSPSSSLNQPPSAADPNHHQQQSSSSSSSSTSLLARLKSKGSDAFGQFRESLGMLKSPSLILLLLTTLSFAPILYATLSFMNQFVSKRYGISIAQTGYVQTVYGVGFLVQSLVVLPLLSKYLTKPSMPARFRARDEHTRDLWLARGSFVAIVLGLLVLTLAPTLGGFVFGLLILAVGSGYSSLVRSVMSIYIDPEHRSRLFSIVSIFDVTGRVYAQPMLAALFAVGLELGGGWVGLPYLGVAAFALAATIFLCFVRLPGSSKAAMHGGNGADDEETLLGDSLHE